MHARRRGRGLVVAEQVEELVAHTGARHRGETRARGSLARQPLRVLLHAEAEAGLVTQRPQKAGGVVDEAPPVEHPDHPALEVHPPAAGVLQLADPVAVQVDRHRVDGEVAPAQVFGQPRRLHIGERPGLRVGLAARGGEVNHQVAGADRGGAEALVLLGLAAEPPGQLSGHGAGVTLDREVEVHGVAPEQEVAHRPADEECRLEAVEGRQQPVHATQLAHARGKVGRLGHAVDSKHRRG